MNLVDRIIQLSRDLTEADIAHAFGGALALAWCTERARATIDIDINLFLPASRAEEAYAALPRAIKVTSSNRAEITSDGQTRLWWDKTPVDVFFNTTEFHEEVATRARFEHFGGSDIPFLACQDLAVFKAFFNRTKDWADLEEMHSADSLDAESIMGTLAKYLGAGDERINRLRSLSAITEK